MPTLTIGSRQPELRLPAIEPPSIEMPDIDLSKIDVSKFDLSKVDPSRIDLSRIDAPDLEKPTAEIAKAIAAGAVAVGLSKPKRSRWPFVLLLGALAVGAWALMNVEAIRARLSRWQATIQERVSEMTAPPYEDAVAFTATEPKPIEDTADVGDYGSADDFPKGFGSTIEMETAPANLR